MKTYMKRRMLFLESILKELQEHISEKAKNDDVKEFRWVGPCEFEMVVSAEDEDDLERKLKEMFGDAIEREK